MTSAQFEKVQKRHNGEHYLTPTDLTAIPIRPRRVLVIGSCLAQVWPSKIDCPNDFVMTNNLGTLPEQPPQPASDYDLQLVQIPLRGFIIPDDAFWHATYLDTEVFEKAFDEAVVRIQQYLQMTMRWNKEHRLLTFVSNIFVPQQNAMGRLAPRYDLRNPVYFIEQLNFQIAKEVATYENAYVLDIDSISSAFGKRYVQDDTAEIQSHASLLGNSLYERDQERIEPIPPMTAHYELHREEFIAAVWHQAVAMYKTLRQEDAVKLVIVDLDNTLWRGVAAESGDVDGNMIEGWPLGLVEALTYLKKRGIVLAVASQNEEKRVAELWSQLFLDRIRLDEFAVVKIDWRPKVEKIDEIIGLVNVLPRNTLFIDDNPVERASVKAAFPEIRTLGQYPYYLKRILLWAPETQVPIISSESARRTEMIQAQVHRESDRKKMSREEFIASLELHIQVFAINTTQHQHFARAFELINKTNQFNTTGKRWTEQECETQFANGWMFYAFTVKDRFTDYGLVGCALISGDTIEQFVMSCRVLGLDIEQRVIATIMAVKKPSGIMALKGKLIETAANFPCRDMFQKCGFEKDGDIWRREIED